MGERTCSIDGCNGTVKCRGWCSKHYTRWQRHGSPDADNRRRAWVCSIDGCEKPHEARGWCSMHHSRWLRTGSTDPYPPKPRKRSSVTENIMRRINIVASGCWEWTGTRSMNGYGRIHIDRWPYFAHRVSYEWFVAPIPDGLVIDHLCRNRACVNPDHLEPVTERVNIMRGEGLAAANSIKTHCSNGHEFTPDNTYRRTDGARTCRTCMRRWKREFMMRKRKKAAA